jgi:outer membrane immunogenic protein
VWREREMMERVLCITAMAIAVSTATHADGYTPYGMAEPFSWTGLYIGVNGGYGFSDFSDKFALTSSAFNGIDPQGGFGGGQIGYNWQSADFVLGVEADIQGSGIEAEATDRFGNVFKSRLDYFATVRGRLGYAFGPALLYATGGFAYGGIRNDAIAGGAAPFTFSGTATGYVLGTGYEYIFSPHWSLKGEYQYINLGRNDPVLAAAGSACLLGPKCEEDAYHTVRFGLNYKFDADRYSPSK